MTKTFGGFGAQRRIWQKLVQGADRSRTARSGIDVSRDHHQEDRSFGSNPGALRMFSYLPPQASAGCALVVVLHGCTQTAAGYDRGAGWSTLADRFGFALLLPEQQRSNNPNGCFNWFVPGDIERGHGEALSIRQMVDKMVSDHAIDPRRVFVTGLSAGGAMASVMLATYPDVFAGGAIIAGLPYGAANNVQQAYESMFRSSPRAAREWGELVRNASPHRGPWPRISIWHGGADATVIPSNANEIVKQWTDVHGLSPTPSVQATVNGHPRRVWLDAAGNEMIESYTIANMAHGTPLAMGASDHECGAAGPFLLEVGISSSYHIAKFFGLASGAVRPVVAAKNDKARIAPGSARNGAPAAAPPKDEVLEGEVLGRDTLEQESDAHPDRGRPPGRIDIGAVITKALQAAGLMKGD